MKKFFLTLMALIALMVASPAANATDWFDVRSEGGETLALNPDITTSESGKSFLVWVRNSFDLPESREYYTRDRESEISLNY